MYIRYVVDLPFWKGKSIIQLYTDRQSCTSIPPCLCVLAPSRTLGQQYCPTILIVREDGGDRKKGRSGVNKRGGRGFVLSNWCFPKVQLLVQSGRVGKRCTPPGGGGGQPCERCTDRPWGATEMRDRARASSQSRPKLRASLICDGLRSPFVDATTPLLPIPAPLPHDQYSRTILLSESPTRS